MFSIIYIKKQKNWEILRISFRYYLKESKNRSYIYFMAIESHIHTTVLSKNKEKIKFRFIFRGCLQWLLYSLTLCRKLSLICINSKSEIKVKIEFLHSRNYFYLFFWNTKSIWLQAKYEEYNIIKSMSIHYYLIKFY